MRRLVFVVAAAFFALPTSAFSQSIQVGPGGVRVDDGRSRGGQCEELRRACENKDRLGEQGEGNCRRYREACQRPVRRDVCSELRRRASTKISWANKVKGIAVGIARLAEDANSDEICLATIGRPSS